MSDKPTVVAIVPHTHWDREWYSPFQTFRMRLVKLLDALLPLLEEDLDYKHFLLDGQTAVLDDYLAIRPEAAASLRRLAENGRLAFGPWMILMDEYMVSGETMIRNLQMGIARATEFGGPMMVGYLPDMFGHVAQMPQILQHAGLDHAVVWRGVPSAIDKTAFFWEAPDGSRVRAEYLVGSYSNGRDLPDKASELLGRARGYEAELGTARLDGGGILLMNGTDHQMPQPWLGRVIEEANAAQTDYKFVVTSLPDYLAQQPSDGITTWRGELRSGARANVLMGVASNRVDVHQACARAERALERRAEPLCALLLASERYPKELLTEAWRQLVLNSAHDSSCACSHDEVVDAVVVRYQEARQIGDGLVRDALHALSSEVDAEPGSTLVVNPTRADRSGLVEAVVAGEGPCHLIALDDGSSHPAQVADTRGGEAFSTVVNGLAINNVLEMMRGPEFAGTRIARYELDRTDDGIMHVRCYMATAGAPARDLEELRDELLTIADAQTTFRFSVVQPPSREIVANAGSVPGFGWRTFKIVDGLPPEEGPSVVAGPNWLENEYMRVEVEPRHGTYAITTPDGLHLTGLGRIIEGGDGGDTYNYSPPTNDLLVDTPGTVAITVPERGPVRARLRIAAQYLWPSSAIGDARFCSDRSEDSVLTEVVTTLELRQGETFLRVHTEWDNRSRDHRVRAHFPLPESVTHSSAECAFAVVERGLETEGGPHETALPTFVSRRFVDASGGTSGIALLHDGLLEYELVEDGSELVLTLLRATGYLSRSELALRPNPAGPLDPLEGPQLQRKIAVDYAVVPHRGDWEDAELYNRADEFLVPLERARTSNAVGTVVNTGNKLKVNGAVVSAVTRDPGGLTIRIFNPCASLSTASIWIDGAPAQGWEIDLLGRAKDRFNGAIELPPARIATLRLS